MNRTIVEALRSPGYHDVTLVVVTKGRTIPEITEVYESGERIFGENKVQELLPKYEAMPKDISWHLVGHLQTNKVKQITPFISLIHSVDSMKLLSEIEKQARINERIIDVLIQIHIATEETKYGLSFSEARALLSGDPLRKLENIRIRGVMGMATRTHDEAQIRKEFKSLKTFFEEVRLKLLNVSFIRDIVPVRALNTEDFNIVSMGMSNDYKIAMEEGSTMVRIGSAIFEDIG